MLEICCLKLSMCVLAEAGKCVWVGVSLCKSEGEWVFVYVCKSEGVWVFVYVCEGVSVCIRVGVYM